MADSQGMFITFEGGEGSGKSTQVRLLANFLEEQGHNVVLTREPGGTPESEKIRELLVQRDGGDWSPMEQCLLFFAARSNLVRTLIRPSLEKGAIVICDRFTDSTRAYQGGGLGMDMNAIEAVNETALNRFEPQLTFLLDIPAAEGLERSRNRLNDEGSNEDKYENLDIVFHEKLRQSFLDLSKQHEDRFEVIDASKSVEIIAKQIQDKVQKVLG